MKQIVLPMLLLAFLNISAQRVAADKIETSKGTLTIQPVFHAGIVFTWNGKTIYVDPYGGANAYKGLATPDVVLFTHAHPDHLDSATLASIDMGKATLVMPKAVADQFPKTIKKGDTRILNNGDKTDLDGFTITAIPMYNMPESPSAKMHPKGIGNGYVLEIGGKRIYISGDTEDTPEMRALINIDVAFVCMNLPYTMDIKHAADAVLAFKPKIVYPYHYRGQDGLSDVEGFKKLVNDGDKSIDVRLRNWYQQF